MTSNPFSPDAWLIPAIAALFGLAFGSFLNVCIYRLPRGMTLLTPSACPNCKSPVRPLDNIPILSWILLGGQCRKCKLPISPRYWMVELLTASLFAGSFVWFGQDLLALKSCVLSFLLVGLVFTDADLKLLPDALTFPGLGMGIAFSLFVPVRGYAEFILRVTGASIPDEFRWRVLSLGNSFLGAALGALFIWGIGEMYKRVRGVEGMGFGDVKLMAMVGAFVGIQLTVLTLIGGSLAGSLAGAVAAVSVYSKRRERYTGRPGASERAWQSARLILRHYEMPFGVFLGAAGLASWFFGQRLVDWYLGLFP